MHGGVTEHVWHLGGELQRRGHRVTVITGAARGAHDRGLRVIRLGVQVPVSTNGAGGFVTLAPSLGRRLRQIEARERFDIVHIHAPLDPVLPLAACRAMRTPKVATHHAARDRSGLIGHLMTLARPFLLESMGRIGRHIAVSATARGFVQRHLPEIALDIVPNGVDTGRFHPGAAQARPPDPGPFTVLFVGRLDPRKGARHLIAALLEPELRAEAIRLILVGAGPDEKHCRALAEPRLRGRVEFAGAVSAEALPACFRRADLFCSPATGNESFGIVLLEAMASGAAVVATDISGYRHVVDHRRDGLLVTPA